jgi:hypothetical protein
MAYRFTLHAQHVARAKRFHPLAMLDAANDPDVSYASHLHPGQHKHIKGDLCVVVDREKGMIITAFLNVVETPLRPDQMVVA